MAASRFTVTERKIAKWMGEGRGCGRASSYRPWLTIHDVSSEGLLVRLRGATTGRIHHLLSSVQLAVFLECDWSSAVVDIREQFPLSRPVTRLLAAEMGVHHPRDRRTDVVMTTHLLIDVVGRDETLSFPLSQGTGRRRIALSIRRSDEVLSLRACERLEIERRYWLSKGVPWHLVVKKDMPEKQWLKLMWLHEWRSLDFMSSIDARVFRDRSKVVLSSLPHAMDNCAGSFTDRMDREHGWPAGTTLSALRYLAANRLVQTPVDTLYDAWGPVNQFVVGTTVDLDAKLVA
jgi:hypothetical protein